jgi:hypothetical protein
MSPSNARSFAEIWTTAEHTRALYCRLLLRRAFRTGRTWLRRRLSASGQMRNFSAIASLHAQRRA